MLYRSNISILALACAGWLIAAQALAAPPKLTHLFPAGGQRGAALKVTGAGEFPSWPVEVWCDQPGVKVTAEQEAGKFHVTIAPDATPGLCLWRVYNAEGASAPRPFLIDQLPEVNEIEPNDAPDKASNVDLPVIINGKFDKSGDVDGYAFKLTQGQTLVASLQANWQLGSPMDCVLQVCELVSRRSSATIDMQPTPEAYVLAQDHDSRGLDPVIVFKAPRDGNYLVRGFAFPSEPNSTIAFAGGDAYVYRLTLTTSGVVEYPFPLVAPGEGSSEVALQGWNLQEGSSRVQLPSSADEARETSRLSVPQVAGAVDIHRDTMPGRIAGPDASTPQGEAIAALPLFISGRFEKPKTMHTFRFTGNKGQKVRFELTARQLGLPLDGVFSIHNAADEQLQLVDDAQKQADPELVFAIPKDGEYRLRVRDLHGRGGPRFAYRLLVAPVTPDYALTLAADQFVLTADKPLEIAVNIDRRDGYAEEITVSALNLPAGVSAEPVVSPAQGDAAKAIKLMLKSAPQTKPWQGPIVIFGIGGADKQRRTASFDINLPGHGRSSNAWLTVSGTP